MCVPVVTPANDDDITGKIQSLSAHEHRLPIGPDLHAVAANREARGFARPQAQARQARPCPAHSPPLTIPETKGQDPTTI
jgi:hypothetical protein